MAGKIKIRITGAGIFGADGEIKVGKVMTLKSEPKGWAGRYVVIDDSEGKEVVTNVKPEEGKEVVTNVKSEDRKNLEAQAAGKNVEFTATTTDDELTALIAAAK